MNGSILWAVVILTFSASLKICNVDLDAKIRDGWLYLTGDLGTPFWTSEAFTLQILTPEKRDEWFCLIDDPTACIFRQVVHWNSTWSSFNAINISNADLDSRDAHLKADALVRVCNRQFSCHMESYCSVTTWVMNWLCLFSYFYLLLMYSKVTP